MRLGLMLLAGQAVAPGAQPSATATFDLATIRRAPPALSVVTRRCGASDGAADVVVCGGGDRHRLPLPTQRAPGGTARDLPGGMAAITPTGPCGIFAGERRCRNADKAAFGYGRGRDPVTLLSRLATKVVDPDAD